MNMDVLFSLICVIFGTLNIILFFKIWGMTNNIFSMKETLSQIEMYIRPKEETEVLISDEKEELKVDVPDNNRKERVSGEFRQDDRVLYPVVNRVMVVEEVLSNGKIRCFQIDKTGKKEPCGDYAPNQIQHC